MHFVMTVTFVTFSVCIVGRVAAPFSSTALLYGLTETMTVNVGVGQE